MSEGTDKVLEIARRFVRAVQVSGIEVVAAYLYGSHSAGTASPDSDIDVAIISPELSGSIFEDWQILAPLRRDIDMRIEPVGFRPEQFRDENPLAWEVKTKGQKIL